VVQLVIILEMEPVVKRKKKASPRVTLFPDTLFVYLCDSNCSLFWPAVP